MLICLLAVTVGLFLSHPISAQQVLPPGQPEQDACDALYLCGNRFTTPFSYQGPGNNNDFSTTPCGGEETNSMWMEVRIGAAGKLAFDIIPVNASDDYDFAVFDMTNRDCANPPSASVVRCNFNNNHPGSNVDGVVGLRIGASPISVEGGFFGNSFCKEIEARAGQTFLIMINNFGDYATGGPSSGFTIDFSASTAAFEGSRVPEMARTVKACSDSSVTVGLSAPIRCNSIAADGSDFYITPAVSISAVTPLNCTYGEGYTREVTIHFASKIPAGEYTVHSRAGSDQNTFLNLCGDPAAPGSLPFLVPPTVALDFLPAEAVKCSYDIISLAPSRTFKSYAWNTGATSPSIEAEFPGPYMLTVTDTNNCVATGTIMVRDSTCPEYFYLPNAFSPNSDGQNDVFKPKFAGSPRNFTFSIYNRWGQKIFESNSAAKGWNGTIGNNNQAADTYVWVCSFTLFRKSEVRKGTVLLVR